MAGNSVGCQPVDKTDQSEQRVHYQIEPLRSVCFFWPLHEYMNQPIIDIRLRFQIYEIRLGIHHVCSTNFPNPIAAFVEGIENKSNFDFKQMEPIIIFTFDAASLSVNNFSAILKRLSAACLSYSPQEISLITSNPLFKICLAIALAPDLKRDTAVRKNEWNKPPTLPYPDWHADPRWKSSPSQVC
ncbi:hypothetical protein AVEN_9195-1 [Araneus ventricosus]|uniref:Uncharacterized protein n=1 Tax=Araneus ventricosus TaxID=182803 RepID=A0A4Y2JPP8_ARAVE|nr:hypothetical protein AVEN_9195-1 [Araneus ventricosus]